MKCITFFCVALNKLIQKIDKRRFASARQQHGGFKSKDRTPGSPSSLLPPDGCPKWAVDSSVSSEITANSTSLPISTTTREISTNLRSPSQIQRTQNQTQTPDVTLTANRTFKQGQTISSKKQYQATSVSRTTSGPTHTVKSSLPQNFTGETSDSDSSYDLSD